MLSLRYRPNKKQVRIICIIFNSKVIPLLLAVVFLSIITSLASTFSAPIAIQVIFAVITLIVSGIFFKFKKVQEENVKFLCPWVPVVPILGIYADVYMIVNLSWITWVRLFVWLVIGFVIYFGYSIRHSKLKEQPHTDFQPLEESTVQTDTDNEESTPGQTFVTLEDDTNVGFASN